MRPVSQEMVHCFKHACSYTKDEVCAGCLRDKLAAQIALEHVQRRYPHANRVTHPQLMHEIDELKRKTR